MGEQISIMGNNMDRMPDIAFRIMSFMFVVRDLVVPAEKKLKKMGIREGDIVVDYGCGPGGYVPAASKLTGKKGLVYAADLHELAVKSVEKRIQKHGLKNVRAVLIKDYACPVPDGTADLIYALDMFHMVKEPGRFLSELRRIIKKNGRFIIEDGHQPREDSLTKILDTSMWKVTKENPHWIECAPV